MKSIACSMRCVAFLLVVGTLGCGESGLPEGDTGTVSGTVTYNDKPVPVGCTVVFMRQQGGNLAIGTTDSSGNYKLLMKSAPDILTGKYNVSVNIPISESSLTPEEIMDLSLEGKVPEQPKSPLPERYLSVETSGLSFDVSKGENSIKIELTD